MQHEPLQAKVLQSSFGPEIALADHAENVVVLHEVVDEDAADFVVEKLLFEGEAGETGVGVGGDESEDVLGVDVGYVVL